MLTKIFDIVLRFRFNRIYLRALRALYGFTVNLEDLVDQKEIATIHEIQLRILLCEVYKSIYAIGPKFMGRLFVPKNVGYNLRSKNLLILPKARSSRYGTYSFLFRGCSLWNSLSDDIKNTTSFADFKVRITTVNLCMLCQCRICKT